MLICYRWLAAASAILLLPGLGAAPSYAASAITFVSGQGANAGDCSSPATPCRTLQFALGQTSAKGEIKVLDPAFYGTLTITKSITIMGVEGASAGRNNAACDGITVNAGPDDAVNIDRLTIDGFKSATNGIVLNSGGSLRITHCTVQNFTSNGILVQPNSGTTALLIADSAVSNNGADGILIFPTVTGIVKGSVERVLMHRNTGSGLRTTRNTNNTTVDITVADSVASNNGTGFHAASQGSLRLFHSAATGNGTGVFVNTAAESAGNNFIRGNGTDVAGFMAKVGTQ